LFTGTKYAAKPHYPDMFMNKKHALIAACLLLMVNALHTQILPDSILSQYNREIPQEKLYIHFDNSLYTPGQTVWYKVYLQSTNGPLHVSSNVYVDWFDDNGNIISKSSAPVLRSTSWGNFDIPAGYTGNTLHAIAYTQWMLNFDSSLIYHKKLQVAHFESKNSNTVTLPATASIKFFAEGGDLVAGLASVLAFRVLNADGTPGWAQGSVMNGSGQTVTSFATIHNGMGKLLFTAQPGERYTAEWKDASGNTYHTQLPAAKTSGISFTVKEGSLDRAFHIEWTKDIPQRTQTFTILAHSNQKVVFRARAALAGKQGINGYFPLNRFPSGVVTLTVMDEAQRPVAERIVFVNNEEYRLNTEIRFDTIGLGKRQKNSFEITIPDSLTASLSLAITDGDIITDTTNNIISSLLLSSEIRGYVHNPAYYFTSDEDSVKQQLDLVMLTNGWRRFAWERTPEQVQAGLKYAKEKEFFALVGDIKQSNGRSTPLEKANSVNLIFRAKDSSSFFSQVPLDRDKRFAYRNLLLFDTVQVFYTVNDVDLKGRTTVKVNTNFFPLNSADRPSLRSVSYTLRPEKPVLLSSAYKSSSFGKMTLADVTVTSYKKPKTRIDELNDEYTSGMFKQGDAIQLDLTDNKQIVASTNIFTYLQSKVPGLRVSYNDNQVDLLWRGINSFAGPSRVAVLLNEMMIDPVQLLNMSMLDIAYIKVFRPPFLGVPLGNGGAGAIAIYTRKGNDSPVDFTGIDKFSVTGYTAIKEFYSPNYSEQNRNNLRDVRQTLFWKPDILSDAIRNRHTIVFYNNDISTSLRVVLEGMTEDGKLVHITQTLR
jgi:hypothetical protein